MLSNKIKYNHRIRALTTTIGISRKKLSAMFTELYVIEDGDIYACAAVHSGEKYYGIGHTPEDSFEALIIEWVEANARSPYAKDKIAIILDIDYEDVCLDEGRALSKLRHRIDMAQADSPYGKNTLTQLID